MLMLSSLLKYLFTSFGSCTVKLYYTGELKENPGKFWSLGLLTSMHNEMMMFPMDIYGIIPDFRASSHHSSFNFSVTSVSLVSG